MQVLPPSNKTFTTKAKDRYHNVTVQYWELLDRHLTDLVEGRIDQMYELQDIAKILCISPKHLIKIVKETTGQHPCHFFVEKILDKARYLLVNTGHPISDIAIRLTYDPSNFTKFFKRHVGITPTQYRHGIKAKSSPLSSLNHSDLYRHNPKK